MNAFNNHGDLARIIKERDAEKSRANKAEAELAVARVEILELREKIGAVTADRNRWKAAHADMRLRAPAREKLSSDPATAAAKRRVVEVERSTARSRTAPREFSAIINRVFPKNGGAHE